MSKQAGGITSPKPGDKQDKIKVEVPPVQDQKGKANPQGAKPTDKPDKNEKAGAKIEKTDKPEKAEKNDKNTKPGAKGDKGDKEKNGKNDGFFLTGHDTPEPAPVIKTGNVVQTSGLLEGYEYLQKQICKHGFPKGNVFEYAAITLLKYERKLRADDAEKKLDIVNKEREKEKRQAEHRDSTGRSPKHEEGKRGSDARSPKGHDEKDRSKSPTDDRGRKGAHPKDDEIIEKGKGKGGKDDDRRTSKSPTVKEGAHKIDTVINDKGKGGKEDDRRTSKSPTAKDAGNKVDTVISDKTQPKPPKELDAKDTGKKK